MINGNGNGIYIPHFLYAYSNAVYITNQTAAKGLSAQKSPKKA